MPLLTAAHYLNVELLLNLGVKTIADAIKDNTPDEIRKALNIENDFTPEEEANFRAEHKWAFV